MRRALPGDPALCALIGACLVLSLALPLAAPQAAGVAAEVEAREVAFARTMADRDLQAFALFISPEAVFFSGQAPLRGREAILQTWAPFFEGPAAPFSWHPDLVEVLDSGRLALTSGPVLSPTGEEVARFNSIWRRDEDGQWRVVFDKGCSAGAD